MQCNSRKPHKIQGTFISSVLFRSLRFFWEYSLWLHHGCIKFADLFTTFLFECFFLYAVSHGADTLREGITGGHTDNALSTGSYPVTLGSQSSPYATPVSTKTELRATRDHHVVDVHQQNTVVPPPQQAHARNEKPSKLINILYT